VGLFSRHEGVNEVVVPALAMSAVVVAAVAAGYFLLRGRGDSRPGLAA
jgi:hypothetical protein